MPLAMTHFAIGAALGMGLLGPFIHTRWRPLLMLASGLWALGPDLNKFLPGLDTLHHSLWANIFWFHQLFDTVETAYPHTESFFALLFLALSVTIVTFKCTPAEG